MTLPQTKYAKSGDLNIAYQVIGDGPFDLVYVPGFISNVELMWDEPRQARAFRDLASFCRLILFDKRGTGLSDRVDVADLPTIEMRMDDVRAVMDAVGSERAALFGHSEGGCMSIVFAATYPERTRALVTYGAFAKRLRSDDYPWAPTFDDRMAAVLETERQWGGPTDMSFYAPSAAGDTQLAEWFATYQRRSASPGAAAALLRMNSFVDVRAILPLVRVPTLVLQANGDRDVRVEEGRYLAAHIPGARYVELPSGDHLWHISHEAAIVGEIQEFLTGVRPLPDSDRFLATVLFTDIVNGTAKAAELGDRGWRALVERHHALVRTELERHRGVEVDTAGDGFFATFDGPARAVRCGLSIRDRVRDLGIEIRAGVHTGECELIAGKTGGIAVIIGSRVREQAAPGVVLATSTVKDLTAGSGLRFESLGTRQLKGVPNEWQIFSAAA
ncbi:MAG TPA: adenylate/guanylate cyclase domain-containing protein [Candidatus Limnocylindria bacterium]